MTMKFRRDAPALLITATVLIIAAITVLTNRLFSGLTTSVEAGQFALMKSIMSDSLNAAAARSMARAQMLADLPNTKRLVAAKDKDKLLEEYGEMFEHQRDQYGVGQVQFHLPPATSLVRLHNPKLFGDDLSKFRPMVVSVNETHTGVKGISIARNGPAIFGVVPIHDDKGAHLGSVEVGIEVPVVLDAIHANYNLEAAIYFEETKLREVATAADPAIMGEQNRVGRYIRYHSTNQVLMKELVSSERLSSATESLQFTMEANGKTYGVLLMPVSNTAGVQLGVIATAQDFSASRAAAGRSLVWQVLLALFGVVFLAGAITIVVRGTLLRPVEMLQSKFAALGAGDTEARVEDADILCAELKQLAEVHETLRAKASESAAAQSPSGKEGET